MLKQTRLGLIGCGVIGQVHLRLASSIDGAAFAAVCDVREEAARAAAERFGVPQVYTDPEALLNDPSIDAVVLALPANLRTALGLRAFACGKHVLTEKPVAMNTAEVRSLIAAQGDFVGACCSSRLRFLPSAQAITAFIATGALGALRVVRCRDVIAAGAPPQNPPPVWRLNKSLNGGGILVNWGCYDLDYLFGITGWSLKPRRVLARTWTNIPDYAAYAAPGSDAETHVAAFVECADGVAFTYERGEFMPTQTDEAWQIIGARGALRMNMKPGQGKQVTFDHPSPRGTVSEVIWEGDEDWDTQHRGPLADFVAAVRERCQPATSLHRALLLQEITDAIYASAAGAGCIELSK